MEEYKKPWFIKKLKQVANISIDAGKAAAKRWCDSVLSYGDIKDWAKELVVVDRSQAQPTAAETGITTAQDKPQEWNGEGLPPRDAKIEVYGGAYGSNEMRWKESVVYAIIDGRVLAESTSHSGEYVLYTHKEIRPIKSQAEKEREEFALEMCKDSGMFGYGENLTAQDAREIYDWLKSTGRLDTKGDV